MPSTTLNANQRKWVSRFLQEHPRFSKIWHGDSIGKGDKLVKFVASQILPLPLVEEQWGWHENAVPGQVSWHLTVTLRPNGFPVKSGNYSIEIIYPHCSLSPKRVCESMQGEGQLSLPLCQLLPSVTQGKNPVVVRPRRQTEGSTKPRRSPAFTQLTLPVSALGQSLLQVHLSKPGREILSEEELLTGRIPCWSEQQRREIQVLQPFVDLLTEMNASPSEWELALSLWMVCGPDAALNFILAIPCWRAALESRTTNPCYLSREKALLADCQINELTGESAIA
jgi:hypothetical protein